MDSNANNHNHNASSNDEAKRAEQKVLEAIRSGEAKARPRWYFVLETAFMLTGGVIALVFVLYLASFIVFVLHQSGVFFAPSFGLAGWYAFFLSLPWILIFLLIVFMLLLALLVEQYAVVYERPAIYLFVGIVIVVVFGGLLLAATPLHRALFNDSEGGGLPVIGFVYRDYGAEEAGDIHRGVIIATTTDGFIIINDNGNTSTVIFGSSSLPLPPGFGAGSNVVIFGIRTPSDTINAQGMQPMGQ